MDDEVKSWVLGTFVAAALLAAIIFGLASLGLLWNRPAAKYAEETRHQVYDTSREYQQGTQLDLDRYCRQYRSADAGARSAVADLIHDTAATYSGPLTDANRACLAAIGEAK